MKKRYPLLLLAGLALLACQSNRPVLRAIADLRTAVVHLDSSYNAFSIQTSRYEQARIDSSVRHATDDELREQIRRITDPRKKF